MHLLMYLEVQNSFCETIIFSLYVLLVNFLDI